MATADVVNDAKLEQLAARRPKDLFPILERSRSLTPLLVVLTFLPGIVAMELASIDEFDAQWRLKSLEVSTASSVFDAVDPSGFTPQPALKWQPPLGTWIAAAAVHLPWPIESHGLMLTDYFCAAAIVPAMWLLSLRLFGARIAFLATVLCAGHVTFLEQFRHAAPHALALVAALGAFWGYWGHVRHARELVSVDLLAGGISLGLCLLSGGPLSFVVVGVLLLLSLASFEPLSAAGRQNGTRAPRIGSGWTALRSLGILAATAFAAGGWWELMMTYSYGTEFLSAWLTGKAGRVPVAGGPVSVLGSGPPALQYLREFFATARVLSGLSLLGIWVVLRAVVSPAASGAARSVFRFLAAWLACALLLFGVAVDDAPARLSEYDPLWRLFLMAACTICAAVAVDEISRRKIGLTTFVGVTAATIVVGGALLRDWGGQGFPSRWAVLLMGAVACAAAVLVIRRYCARSELRERLILAGLIAAHVAADATIGLSAVRSQDADSRSLAAFRQSLPAGFESEASIEPEACVLISEIEPPYRLKLALKSVWPDAQLLVVRDWDEAIKVAVGDSQTPKSAVVADWSRENARPANPTGALWEADPVGRPQFFAGKQLRAYVLVWGRKNTADDDRPPDRSNSPPAP